jgi:hypothetical protein
MYLVKYKAVLITPKDSPIKYKPFTQSGLFVPKGKTCKKEKIEKQCIAFITPQLKCPPGIELIVSITSIHKLPNSFVCVEDK